jgi:hypothetical protein
MADHRRRHLRRNALILAGSLIGHMGAFYLALENLRFYPPPPLGPEQPVEIQVVAPPPEMPPPPPPIIKPQVTPTPKPPSPPPQPTPQPPRPQPTPQPTPPRPAPQPAPTPTSPAPATVKPTPTPTPKPAPAPTPTPLAPPTPAPQPGPPRAVSAAAVVQPQTRTVAAPHITLHRDRNQNSQLTTPSVAIPGATFAPSSPPTAGAPTGGAGALPGGALPGGGGFPGGALPGFGSGLRGGLLGCANADALHLTAEERARCAESFGQGTRESPQMNPIDASKRVDLDRQAASEAAAAKYRDSTPAGTESTPVAGQPRVLTSPGQ